MMYDRLFIFVRSRMEENKEFYQQVLRLMLPVVIQNLLSAAVSSADVIMLGYVGQSAISSIALATQYATILNMLFNGLGTGIIMLCAQYYGKKDLTAIKSVEGMAFTISAGFSSLLALAAFLIPQYMMKLFTNDIELITTGASYLRIISISYLCMGIAEVYIAVLRSLGQVRTCMYLNALAFTLNIILNAVFIFGLFGAPKLGVMGVAIATSISRFVELLACFAVSAGNSEIKLNPFYIRYFNPLLMKDFFQLSMPAVVNSVIWSVGFSMYSVILGHLSSDVVAANSLVTVVRSFGTVFCYGVATASGILLGNIMGSGEIEKARSYASKLIRAAITSGILGGLIILGITPFILRFATLTDKAMYYLKYMLLINSVYIMGTAMNSTIIVGFFRSGGDSKFGMICDAIDMWCYAVPIGFLIAFVFRLPVLVVYLFLCTDEFVKWPWVFKRYRSGKWLRNITRDNLF